MAKRCYVKHLGSCTFEVFFFFLGGEFVAFPDCL